MTKPRELARSIERVAQDSGSIDERPTSVLFVARFSASKDRIAWDKIRREPPPFISRVTFLYADSDVELPAEDDIPDGHAFDVSLLKRSVEHQTLLFFSRSLAQLLERGASSCIRIADMGGDERFKTGSATFQEWTDAPPEFCATIENLVDPRKLVRNLSSRDFVPADVRHWILVEPPSVRGSAFQTWAKLATTKSLASIVNHVTEENKLATFHLNGPPSSDFTIVESQKLEVFDSAQLALKWIYADGRDADTRHLFFTSEFARSFRSGELLQSIDHGLESARLAYGAHAKSASRETLKALADLRKNVADETQRIAQRAQDLTASLWRDLAVAAAPFVLRILPVGAINDWISIAFPLSAALFLLFSLSIQVWLNEAYFTQQSMSRSIWQQLLSPYLSSDEFKEFSDTPITGAMNTYRHARLAVGIAYFVLIVALILFAFSNDEGLPPLSKPADG